MLDVVQLDLFWPATLCAGSGQDQCSKNDLEPAQQIQASTSDRRLARACAYIFTVRAAPL